MLVILKTIRISLDSLGCLPEAFVLILIAWLCSMFHWNSSDKVMPYWFGDDDKSASILDTQSWIFAFISLVDFYF